MIFMIDTLGILLPKVQQFPKLILICWFYAFIQYWKDRGKNEKFSI